MIVEVGKFNKIVALAGGVGGAKLADGLARVLPPENLTIIVNTGDDFRHLGLWVSPDLDTVCYTLAGLANPETGWGRKGESWRTLGALGALGGPDWFRLGDLDLATHLERTRLMDAGISLTEITRRFCRAWGVGPDVLPMSEDPAPTIVLTEEGELPFQEYFVRRRTEPRVKGFRFEGSQQASPEVIRALEEADAVILCPSNPWVSIDPIRCMAGVETLLERKALVAVSPLIAGQALKGPAARMFAEMGITPSVEAVAGHYEGILDGLVVDTADAEAGRSLAGKLKGVLVTGTWMKTPIDRERLAREVLEFTWTFCC